MELFSSSYYRTFRDRVNQDLLDMDRLRYFDIDIKELLTDCSQLKTRVEVMLNGIKSSDNINEKDNRSFDMNAAYKIKMSIPYCREFDYIENIEIYLNENKIYMREGEEEIIPGQTN